MILDKQQETTIKEANISGLYKLHNSHDYHFNSDHTNKEDDSKTRLGIILGCTFAVIIVLLITITACFLIVKRKRKKKGESGWTKEVIGSGTTGDNTSLNDTTTSSLVVEYVDQPTVVMDDEERHVYNDSDDDVPEEMRHSDSDNQVSASTTPNRDGSARELLSQHTSSLHPTSTLEPPQSVSNDPISPQHPTVTIISPPQPTDNPRESSETASGSFDCPPWNRNSRFQEFF